MPTHCENFSSEYSGCRECPGLVEVTQQDGTVDRICRAGERFLRDLLALESRTPDDHAEGPGER